MDAAVTQHIFAITLCNLNNCADLIGHITIDLFPFGVQRKAFGHRLGKIIRLLILVIQIPAPKTQLVVFRAGRRGIAAFSYHILLLGYGLGYLIRNGIALNITCNLLFNILIERAAVDFAIRYGCLFPKSTAGNLKPIDGYRVQCVLYAEASAGNLRHASPSFISALMLLNSPL